jgi:hypothetical protein
LARYVLTLRLEPFDRILARLWGGEGRPMVAIIMGFMDLEMAGHFDHFGLCSHASMIKMCSKDDPVKSYVRPVIIE